MQKKSKSKFSTNFGDLVISCPKDLLGKMIQHFTNSEKPEELLWVEGIVLMIFGDSSSNSNFFLPNLLS